MIINWGDAPFKAFITVTYPRGTCTVTGEGQTYTHSGGGTTTFTVKKKGTYTVKIAYSTISNTGSVSITKLNEAKTISLDYKLYLFNGSDNSSVTGGWDFYGWDDETTIYKSGKLGFYYDEANDYDYGGRSPGIYTVKAIDLSPYVKLCARITGLGALSSCAGYLFADSGYNNANFNSPSPTAYLDYYTKFTSTGVVTLDLSSVSASKDVGLAVGYASGIGTSRAWVYATEVWLE